MRTSVHSKYKAELLWKVSKNLHKMALDSLDGQHMKLIALK